MNKVQKIDYIHTVSEHLEKHCVFELFEKLTRELIVHKPEKPIDFLIDRLKKPDGKRIFIVGPPGSNVRERTLELSGHFGGVVVSVGDLLKKEVNKKTEVGEKIDGYIRDMLYVPDDIVVKVLKEHLDTLDREKDFFVEGFPKTPYQSMALIREGIIPDLFMIVNFPDNSNKGFAKRKFAEQDNELWGEVSETERSLRGNEYLQQYQMNITDLKMSYKNNLIEVEGDSPTILNDMAALIQFRIKASTARNFRVLIIGPPGSGRTTIAKRFSKKYGFVSVSSSELLLDQINRKTEVGTEVTPSFTEGNMVSDEIMFGLLKSRLAKADCKLHGYCMEGFPKSYSQLSMLKDLEMKLKPHLYIILECEHSTCSERLKNEFLDPVTLKTYNKDDMAELDLKISDRLEPIPYLSEEVIQKRLERWENFKKQIYKQDKDMFYYVNTDGGIENIIESISYLLQNMKHGKKNDE